MTTDKSQVGITKNIFCNVVITKNGEPMSHLIAQGTVLRIDAPKAKPSVAAVTAKAEGEQ